MKKRGFALLLALVLALTLLPGAALAGGGGAGWYWPSSLDRADSFQDWTVLDGNNDGYTFRRLADPTNDSAYMSSALDANNAEGAAAMDEYLISPQITLSDGQEYTLYFQASGQIGSGMLTLFDVYVYTGGTRLTAGNLPELLKPEQRAYGNNAPNWWITHNFDLTAYRGKTIQIVFHHYNHDAGPLLLRDVTVYWQQPDEILDKVTATNVPVPVAGKTPAALQASEITFPDFANYELVPGSLTYYRIISEQMVPQTTEPFEIGGEYEVSFDVRPTTATDISATENGLASVNGKSGFFRHNEDNTVTVFASFGYLRSGPTYIPELAVELPIPYAGDTFDNETQDGGAKLVDADTPCTIADANWFNEWGLSEANMKFEAGEKYFAEIHVTPNEGYFFDELTVATINGIPAATFREINVSTWVICTENMTFEPKPVNPFSDVPKDAYYETPVLWAVNHKPQITKGVASDQFAPDQVCTRAQIVTFLWRAMGEPEPTTSTCPFTDVTPNDYFYKAVLWAVENGITAGTSPTTFSPNDGCTRAQVVTFLWRAEGKPAPRGKQSPFTDVTGDYFFDAVLWAVEQDITKGTGGTFFSPSATCTRGQIVTFLYRDMA